MLLALLKSFVSISPSCPMVTRESWYCIVRALSVIPELEKANLIGQAIIYFPVHRLSLVTYITNTPRSFFNCSTEFCEMQSLIICLEKHWEGVFNTPGARVAQK